MVSRLRRHSLRLSAAKRPICFPTWSAPRFTRLIMRSPTPDVPSATYTVDRRLHHGRLHPETGDDGVSCLPAEPGSDDQHRAEHDEHDGGRLRHVAGEQRRECTERSEEHDEEKIWGEQAQQLVKD